MKSIVTIITFYTCIISSGCRQSNFKYTEIDRVQFDTCTVTNFLFSNPKIKKKLSLLTVVLSNNSEIIFTDIDCDTAYRKYDYLGDVKESMLSLVKLTEYNSEDFYLINRSSGIIDTLIGLPVFSADFKTFACANNPWTDEDQYLQVCQIKKGSLNSSQLFALKNKLFIEEIGCVQGKYILVKGDLKKYWRINF